MLWQKHMEMFHFPENQNLSWNTDKLSFIKEKLDRRKKRSGGREDRGVDTEEEVEVEVERLTAEGRRAPAAQ